MSLITFAHRGGAADRPENTLGAFRAARERGARGVESDVRLAADGTPVLTHDGVVRSGLRRVKVAGSSPDQLAEWGVPTLDALYDVVGPDLEVSLDLKVPEAAGPAIAVARRHGAAERLWLCSPSLDDLVAIRGAHDDVKLVHSTARQAITVNLERHAASLADEAVDAVNFHRRDWSAGLVVLFHRFDVAAFAWDVQEVRHLREALAFGMDAVYCDHVDRMVAVVAEFESEAPPAPDR